jgi:hypothetical protein
MKVVYKYPLEIAPLQTVTMPAGARTLIVGLHPNAAGELRPFVWALVDTNGAPTQRAFVMLATGEDAADAGAYIGSIFPDDFVFHVFTHRVLP